MIEDLLKLAFQFLFQQLLEKTRAWCTFVERLLTFGLLDAFWKESFIQQSINMARTLSLLLVGASLVFVLFDIAEESNSGAVIDWGRIVSNFAKGFTFAYVAPEVGRIIMFIANQLVMSFRVHLEGMASGRTDIGIILLYTIGFWGFLITTMMRVGSMYVLSMTAPFYVPDIMRGQTSAIGEWGRQVIAIGFTYILQYILFYLGVFYLEAGMGTVLFNGEPMKLIMGVALWLTIAQVPKLLAKFGMSSGTAGVVSSAANTVRGASYMFNR